jgi:hypothetical protein
MQDVDRPAQVVKKTMFRTREAHALLVAGTQVGRGGELGEEARRARQPGEPIELHELVAVGGEDERHGQALARRVELALF